mmetsp:Transcript_4505/g.13642  ORF Transcript_4505/g.13642 Transcript_4505/m.13642 type:complete len:218 (-) Transcript_4505:65-718(-)|eukprot:scaffold160489_cov28-Tisochrysis_lutea.AAC.1
MLLPLKLRVVKVVLCLSISAINVAETSPKSWLERSRLATPLLPLSSATGNGDRSNEIVPSVGASWASIRPIAAAPVVLIRQRCITRPCSSARKAPCTTYMAASSPIGLPNRERYFSVVLVSMSLPITTAANGPMPLWVRSIVSSCILPSNAETGIRALQTVAFASSSSRVRMMSVCSDGRAAAAIPSARASAPGTLKREASTSRDSRAESPLRMRAN